MKMRKQEKTSEKSNFKNKTLIKIATRYVPLGILHAAFLTVFILSSLVIVYRMAPDSNSASVTEAVDDFFEPLDKLAPDKVGEKFLQASSNTCGPAVLAYLFSFYGHEVLETDLIPAMTLSKKGSSMLELKKTAINNGFQAKGVKENYTALMNEPLPVIAYINDSHYVVVNKITASNIYLFDPLLGHVQLRRDVFERAWNGYLLLVNVEKIKKTI